MPAVATEDNGPVRRRGILLAVWLVGTMLATSLAWSAVGLVGARVTDQPAAATDLVVANSAPDSSSPQQPGNTTTTVAPVVTGVAEGGQATFTCDGDTPQLVDASPNVGWDRDHRAPVGEVWFDKDGNDSAIVGECDDGVPSYEVEEEEYDEGSGEADDPDDVTTTVATTAATTAPPVTADDGDDGSGSGPGSDDDDAADDAADEAEDRADDAADEAEDRAEDEADDDGGHGGDERDDDEPDDD